MEQQPPTPLLAKRRAGILLHPTSLPGSCQFGDIGQEAFHFVEFLAAAGFTLWQMLPLGPTHPDRSPYLCLSANACNPTLISLEWLQDRGLIKSLQHDENTIRDDAYRQSRLKEAYTAYKHNSGSWQHAFDEFVAAESAWLDDFALFMTLREHHDMRPWYTWERRLRDRDTATLEHFRQRYRDEVAFHQFCQFIFHLQWQELRDYAQQHGVYLFGDLPIYLSRDSADIWVNREIFLLDENAVPRYVAGVPPDFFSEEGQRWGNPIYNWEYLEETGFTWWVQRVKRQLELFDLLRIDHFRGLQAYWCIPAKADSALVGEWVEAPGDALLCTLREQLGTLPFVAEDLGLITEEVDALRTRHHLPGMKILQFAFDGDPTNSYLPHNHHHDAVAYSGTHDNDTILGWYQQLDDSTRRLVAEYLRLGEAPEGAWPFISAVLSSVATTAVFPLQDILGLGSEARMNTPGTMEGNWGWRFTWGQLPYELAPRLRHLCHLYGRCN